MSKLKDLIVSLKTNIENRTSYIRNIAYPDKLISSLQELSDMIGNEEIKDSIASQTSYLINKLNDPNPKKCTMLNTILYGGPGIGKTTIGVIMAKIWHGLGYLKSNKREIMTQIKETVFKKSGSINWDSIKKIFEDRERMSDLILVGLLIFYIFYMVAISTKFIAGYIGWYWLLCGLGIMIFFIIIFIVMGNSSSTKLNNQLKVMGELQGDGNDDDLIKIVSRENFIAKYQGWSDKKTVELLEANKDKVTFIDEFYSLYGGPYDSYGIEVLNTLNRYLSEHPNQVVIVAGYKKLMEKGAFKAQPGLPRRFMWHFSCTDYTAKELMRIFIIQMEKVGYKVGADEDRLYELFSNKIKSFPSQGGDTGKLTFFVELEYSDDLRDRNGKDDDRVVSLDQIKRGIKMLERNNINANNGDTGNHQLIDFLE